MENRIQQLVYEKINTIEYPSMNTVLDRAYSESNRRNSKKRSYYKIIAMAACFILLFSFMYVLVFEMHKPDTEGNKTIAYVEPTMVPVEEQTIAPTCAPTGIPDKVITNTEAAVEKTYKTEVDIEIQINNSDTIQNTEVPKAIVVETTTQPEENSQFYDKTDGSEVIVPDNDSEEEIIEITPVPEDSSWTENFVASNSEYRFGIDKSESISLVDKLYFSSLSGGNLSTEAPLESSWEYTLQYNGFTYTQACVEVEETYLETGSIESILNGFDTKGVARETTATIHKLSGVNPDAAIAVEIKEQSGYFIFVNSAYKPETVQEFINSYCLMEYSVLKAIAIYEDWNTNVSRNIDAEEFWDILLSADSSLASSETLYTYDVSSSIEIDCELYGCIDIPVALYDEGYIVFCLDTISGVYNIGEDKVKEIKNLYQVSDEFINE